MRALLGYALLGAIVAGCGAASAEATPAEAQGSGRPVGELLVMSPNAPGEVWVNGKRIGFPPAVAKRVPAGMATVEIRSDGQVRRKQSVMVESNKRATLYIR
jgi:ABC-type amino acid transport substrate-binding protein